MKFSKETLTLIKNFSGINGALLLQPGNRLSTISEGRNIFAEATITEEFSSRFGIYDLGEFLNAMSVFSNPELIFHDQYVIISGGSESKIKYFGAGEGIVKEAPNTIKFPDPEIVFPLEANTLATIIKTANVLKTTDISIVGNKDTGYLTVIVSDKKNSTANAYEDVIAASDTNFQANFKLESLKALLAGSYNVSISSKKISRFENTAIDLRYFVAVEADSVFDE
jgi:hypothetical protein